MTIRTGKKVYRRFTEFEERAAAIYLKMAARFPDDHELASLWFDLAMHEKEHAGLLQFCLCESCFASDLPNEKDIRRISGLFRSLEKRAASPDLGIRDAFAIAVEMETSEINDIYCHLTTPLHRSTYLLRRKITTAMPDHIDRLYAAGRKWNIPGKLLKNLDHLRHLCPAA